MRRIRSVFREACAIVAITKGTTSSSTYSSLESSKSGVSEAGMLKVWLSLCKRGKGRVEG